MTWDPDQYARFSGERSRPFFDLLAQVRKERVGAAVDLGCGPGELTRALAERWPEAEVLGVDSSPEMLARAEQWSLPGRLGWQRADIGSWRSDRPLDLVFSNAALQWVEGHDALLPALVGMLAPGGVLAVQMPHNLDQPSHRTVAEVARRPRWRDRLEGVGLREGAVKPLAWYAALLRGLGLAVDAWETTYLHILSGEDAVLEWLKGTGLRPALGRLSPEEAAEFLAEVGAGLRAAYPKTGANTFFPFPRLFFVAARPQ
jgi:trans-aconitate 2-methyltransferase